MNDKSHAATPANATPDKPVRQHLTDGPSLVVSGNWGKLVCSAETGNVLSYDRRDSDSECDTDGYYDITRIDIPLFRKQWGYPDVSEVDILHVGFWLEDGRYEPPAAGPSELESELSAGVPSSLRDSSTDWSEDHDIDWSNEPPPPRDHYENGVPVATRQRPETVGERLKRFYPEHYVTIITRMNERDGPQMTAHRLGRTDGGSVLDGAFRWEATPEGYEFWKALAQREQE